MASALAASDDPTSGATTSPAAAHASTVVAAAATGASLGCVFVKRAGDAHARFAEVAIFEADTVARLAMRCSRERGWSVDAAYLELFVVPEDMVRDFQRNLVPEADVLVNRNQCLATDLLAEANIHDRFCLLALCPRCLAGTSLHCGASPSSLASPLGASDCNSALSSVTEAAHALLLRSRKSSTCASRCSALPSSGPPSTFSA